MFSESLLSHRCSFSNSVTWSDTLGHRFTLKVSLSHTFVSIQSQNFIPQIPQAHLKLLWHHWFSGHPTWIAAVPKISLCPTWCEGVVLWAHAKRLGLGARATHCGALGGATGAVFCGEGCTAPQLPSSKISDLKVSEWDELYRSFWGDTCRFFCLFVCLFVCLVGWLVGWLFFWGFKVSTLKHPEVVLTGCCPTAWRRVVPGGHPATRSAAARSGHGVVRAPASEINKKQRVWYRGNPWGRSIQFDYIIFFRWVGSTTN